jgi:hypothetical protein
MSNALRLEVDKTAFHLDAASARRQFWLSLGVGLAVLAVAAMIDLQPTHVAPRARSARPGQISAPEFVGSPVGVAQLRRSMTIGANSSAD